MSYQIYQIYTHSITITHKTMELELIEKNIYREDVEAVELAKYIGANYCNFDQNELEMMDVYWDVAFNKSWMYASNKMVSELFGYKVNESMMKDFGRKLKKEFRENIEYQIVTKDHELVKKFNWETFPSKDPRGGALKKYYIITGKTFKDLLLNAGTTIGKQTRDYYIKIEDLAMTTMSAMVKCMRILSKRQEDEYKKDLELKKQELEKAAEKMLKLNDFVEAAQELKKDNIFYLATTNIYARQNRFKFGGIGKTNDLRTRLATYNTGRPENDLYYICKLIPCHNYQVLENCLKSLVSIFKDKKSGQKELLHMRYDCLADLVDFIAENHNREMSYINQHARRFIDATVNEKPVVPPPISIENCLVLSRRKNGKEKVIKIDVSDWEESKVEDLIKDMISTYATKNLKKPDYTYNKNDDINIVWKEFKLLFGSYTQPVTYWKDKINKLIEKEKSKLKIKWRSAA